MIKSEDSEALWWSRTTWHNVRRHRVAMRRICHILWLLIGYLPNVSTTWSFDDIQWHCQGSEVRAQVMGMRTFPSFFLSPSLSLPLSILSSPLSFIFSPYPPAANWPSNPARGSGERIKLFQHDPG